MPVDGPQVTDSPDRTDPVPVSTTVNGRPVTVCTSAATLLVDFLRDELGLRGTKRSCDVQMCGTCTVLVDGRPVSSCCHLAVDVDRRDVRTIEGLADPADTGNSIYQLFEDAFVHHAAVQCGFCTPGFLVTLTSLVRDGTLHAGSRSGQICAALRGNICRCTGYEPILHAVESVLATLPTPTASGEQGGTA
ncbi:MAG: 2Fe-2S iron-sulfur cluster binding domain-containing protein [Propionibacteriales bacterium]|nr:2Fe-2S iron-sulfur cluster binding domain-containing protein [Propionibacteriales bacterium]